MGKRLDNYRLHRALDNYADSISPSRRNMSNTSSSSGGGIGFAGLLTILFIGLKLGHVINWSWVWVLSPLWISFALFLVIVAVVLIVVGLSS